MRRTQPFASTRPMTPAIRANSSMPRQQASSCIGDQAIKVAASKHEGMKAFAGLACEAQTAIARMVGKQGLLAGVKSPERGTVVRWFDRTNASGRIRNSWFSRLVKLLASRSTIPARSTQPIPRHRIWVATDATSRVRFGSPFGDAPRLYHRARVKSLPTSPVG